MNEIGALMPSQVNWGNPFDEPGKLPSATCLGSVVALRWCRARRRPHVRGPDKHSAFDGDVFLRPILPSTHAVSTLSLEVYDRDPAHRGAATPQKEPPVENPSLSGRGSDGPGNQPPWLDGLLRHPSPLPFDGLPPGSGNGKGKLGAPKSAPPRVGRDWCPCRSRSQSTPLRTTPSRMLLSVSLIAPSFWKVACGWS